jgi:F0F1-type ATP synthase membrane subunit c/vacuolar-type H+-ATPase subunit K
VAVDVVDLSLQPHQPGVAQLVELDVKEDDAGELLIELLVELIVELTIELLGAALLVAGVSELVVRVDAGSALGDVIVVVRVIVVGSLQPNHPGDLQEEVVIVLVMVVVGVVVVDSSRQPHQPGVLQVSVRVCEVVLDGLLVLLVVVSLLLLSKNFQLKQS